MLPSIDDWINGTICDKEHSCVETKVAGLSANECKTVRNDAQVEGTHHIEQIQSDVDIFSIYFHLIFIQVHRFCIDGLSVLRIRGQDCYLVYPGIRGRWIILMVTHHQDMSSYVDVQCDIGAAE